MLNEYRHYLISIRRSPNTIRLRCVYVKQLLVAFPSPGKVRPSQLEEFIFANPAWKPETINAAISSVKSFYSWAHRYGKIKVNPSIDLEAVKVPRIPRPIVPDATLIAALAIANDRDKAIILLGGEDGLRRDEIASLHTRHRTGEVLTVTGKGEKTRVVKLSPEAAQVLDALQDLNGHGFFFRGRFGGHVHPSTIYAAARRLLGFNTHAMRHRAITTVYRNGGHDVFLTQKFAGHSSSDTTLVYIHFEDDDMDVASEAARIASPLAA